MSRPLFRFTAAAGLAMAALAVSPEAGRAETTEVTVGGVTYTLSSLRGKYIDNVDAIQATPWWGKETLAEDIATAVRDTGSTVSGSLDYYAYALASGERVETWIIVAGTVGNSTPGETQDNVNYIVGSAAEIPEIDGAVLAQLTLVLGVGWLVTAARRENAAPAA
jgi:hypothetical protein